MITATRAPRPSLEIPARSTAFTPTRSAKAGRRSISPRASGASRALSSRTARTMRKDLQISSRGFGARATFGVRGIRLISDGIPATMPDGQGQASTFALGLCGTHRGAARTVLEPLRQRSRRGDRGRDRGSAREADGGDRRDGRQLRYLAGRSAPRRLQHAVRCIALREATAIASTARRGATSTTSSSSIALRAEHVAHDHRQPAAPARDAGSAGPDAGAGRAEPAAGDAAGAPVQHTQDRLPGAARRHARASLERRFTGSRPPSTAAAAGSSSTSRFRSSTRRRRRARAAWCSSTATTPARRCALHRGQQLAILRRRGIRPHG